MRRTTLPLRQATSACWDVEIDYVDCGFLHVRNAYDGLAIISVSVCQPDLNFAYF